MSGLTEREKILLRREGARAVLRGRFLPEHVEKLVTRELPLPKLTRPRIATINNDQVFGIIDIRCVDGVLQYRTHCHESASWIQWFNAADTEAIRLVLSSPTEDHEEEE